MSTKNKTILGCLGAIGAAFLGIAVMVALNWDVVSKNFSEGVAVQSEKTQTTLFRWGELMSIGAELKREYGEEPETTYEKIDGVRTLSISFTDYRPLTETPPENHAREIAGFVIGKTNKSEQIDVVQVIFPASFMKEAESTAEPEPYRFALDDLAPDDSATE